MVKTAQGNSISLYKNEKHNSVLVLACMHGDEPQGEYLIKEYLNFNPNTKLMFVPCVNPDGVASKTRVNSNGVDINRNFPTKNWELTEKNEFFGGEKPMSEIETKFLVDVIEQNKPNLILTLHAPFKVVNYDGDAQEVAEKIYNKLMEAGVPVIIDDRAQGMLGAKIKDCYMFGTPYMLVLGNKAQEGSFEIESTKTGEKKTFTEDELIEEFVKMNNARKYVK